MAEPWTDAEKKHVRAVTGEHIMLKRKMAEPSTDADKKDGSESTEQNHGQMM